MDSITVLERKLSFGSVLLCLGLVAVGCPLLDAAEPQPAVRPPPESFFMPAGILQTALSPDGTHLVYLKVEGQQTDIFLLDLNTGAAVSLMRLQRVTALFWKGNDTVMFNSPSFKSAGIITISKHAFRRLQDLNDKVSSFSMVSASLPSSSSDVVVGSALLLDNAARVDVLTGGYELLFSPLKPMNGESTSRYVADKTGEVRARVYQARTDTQLQVRKHNGGSFKTVKGWPIGEPIWELQGIADDGSNLFLITRDDTDFGALHLFDPDQKKLGPVVATLPWPNVELTGVVFSPDGKQLAGLSYLGDTTGVYWLDEARRNILAKLETSFPGTRVHLAQSSPDGKVHVVRVESTREPGAVYVLDLRKPALSLLQASNPPLPLEQMPAPKAFDIKARDGQMLHCYLTLPVPAGAGPAPLILCPYKEPFSGRFSYDYDCVAQFWASRGYAFMRLNYRGCYGYGMSYQRAGDGEIGGRMIDDVNDAAHWAVAGGYTRAGQICLYGEGLSAGLAIVAAAEDPGLYRSLIDIEGITDWPTMLYNMPFSPAKHRYLISSDAMKSRSPLAVAKNLRVPILDIHADPLNEERELEEACKKAGVSFKRAEHLGWKTGPFFLEAREVYLTRQIEPFLAKCFAGEAH